MPAPLERLPEHILEYIAEYVAGCRRRSLFDFSLASRLCCRVTTPQRFAFLKLTIRDKEKLQHDLQRWTEVLSPNHFRHVRRVTVIGFMRDNQPVQSRDNGWREDFSEDFSGDGDDDDEDSPCYDFSVTSAFIPDFPHLMPQHKDAQHEAWLPFANFLGQLPGLKDLIYACAHHMPPYVLRALHQHHRRSRLHIRAFSLRSLYQYPDQLDDIDPDKFALVTSPYLYSINANLRFYDACRGADYNWDAVARMVSGFAPALRRVRVNHSSDLRWRPSGIKTSRPT